MQKNPAVYCPVLSLEEELAELTQQLVLSPPEQQLLARRVGQFPQASAILLQLLRHNEITNDQAALWAESLAYGVLQQSGEFQRWLQQRVAGDVDNRVESTPPLQLTRSDNVLHICLDRPHARNAYSALMRDALFEALMLLELDQTLERCIIEGAGECFCVGGDLVEFGRASDGAWAHRVRMERHVTGLMLKHAARIECRVHRACIGSGIELAAAADKLVANPETFFQLPELSMGLIPGAGGTVSILRRIGRHRLAWWVLSGKRINAQTALQWKLIDQIL